MSISSSSARPSPIAGRVGIRDFTFEACSGFTHVTARPVAQPPKAAFVTRLRSGQLPSQTARQLPDLSTIIWMDSSSIGYPCLFRAHQLSEGTPVVVPNYPQRQPMTHSGVRQEA